MSRYHRRYKRKNDLFEELAKIYGRSCLICGEDKRLVIDHDHETGAVRGLLCYTHNTGLGMFQDNRELLMNAIKYLDNYSFIPAPIIKKKKLPFPFKDRLETLINDPSFSTDTKRAETLKQESGISRNAAQARISRWRKQHHLQTTFT